MKQFNNWWVSGIKCENFLKDIEFIKLKTLYLTNNNLEMKERLYNYLQLMVIKLLYDIFWCKINLYENRSSTYS